MRRSKTVKAASVLMTLILALTLMVGCAKGEAGTLTIYHAGSLSVPFEDLAAEFEKTHPNVQVLLESAGSAATIRKVTELGKTCDIIASADYTLITGMMYPDYAHWYIAFARSEIVLGYRDAAPFATDIVNGSRTWYDVLIKENVKYGHSNPDDDPCGYRALMVCQLAEKHHNVPGLYDALIHGSGMDKGRISIDKEVVRPKEVDLIALMEIGELDYMFQYKSVCVQHGIDYIELDDAINLSSLDYTGFYSDVSLVIQKTPTETQAIYGKPIVYGVTIPKNAQNKELATEFIAFLLSEEGQDIMEENGQPCIVPPLCDHPENLPAQLREKVS